MSRWPSEPISEQVWESGDNRASVAELGEHVLGITMTGCASAGSLELIEPSLSSFLSRSKAARIFWDAQMLDSYEASLRDTVVKILLKQRKQWKTVDVLFSSGLIGAAVTTVGLAFMGSLKGHRDPDKFFGLVREALRESGR